MNLIGISCNYMSIQQRQCFFPLPVPLPSFPTSAPPSLTLSSPFKTSEYAKGVHWWQCTTYMYEQDMSIHSQLHSITWRVEVHAALPHVLLACCLG